MAPKLVAPYRMSGKQVAACPSMAAAMDDPHFSVRQPIPARVPEQRHFPAARQQRARNFPPMRIHDHSLAVLLLMLLK